MLLQKKAETNINNQILTIMKTTFFSENRENEKVMLIFTHKDRRELLAKRLDSSAEYPIQYPCLGITVHKSIQIINL